MKTPAKLLATLLIACICLASSAQESKPESAQSPSPSKSPQPATNPPADAPSNAPATTPPPPNTNPYQPSTETDEAAACKRNLEKINLAIQAYQKDNQRVPDWLSDLVPKYLADTNALICPVSTRTGHQSPFGVLDPKIFSSYVYEFTSTEIPDVVKGSWPGPKMTMREWKQQQMKLAGSNVPLVRCILHEPVLNLSIGGKVYESPVFWELNFTNSTTKLEDFTPH